MGACLTHAHTHGNPEGVPTRPARLRFDPNTTIKYNVGDKLSIRVKRTMYLYSQTTDEFTVFIQVGKREKTIISPYIVQSRNYIAKFIQAYHKAEYGVDLSVKDATKLANDCQMNDHGLNTKVGDFIHYLAGVCKTTSDLVPHDVYIRGDGNVISYGKNQIMGNTGREVRHLMPSNNNTMSRIMVGATIGGLIMSNDPVMGVVVGGAVASLV